MSKVRQSCAKVMQRARHVRIFEDAISEFALQYSVEPEPWAAFEFHYTGAKMIEYIFALDSLNFCFWPHCGYDYPDLARNLKVILENDADGLNPERISEFSSLDLLRIFPNDFHDLETRLGKIRELGRVTVEKFGGRYENILSGCENSGLKLVEIIYENFEGFRDVFDYNGETVYLLKRAQILVSDLFGAGCWRFEDMDELTMFPDYQVPQVLNSKGVLNYSDVLQSMIDGLELIEKGSEYELEIRAATVVACDLIAGVLKQPVYKVDWLIWQIGENEKKLGRLRPHHRTITTFY